MMRSGVIVGLAASVIVFVVPAAGASRARQRAIHAGCPSSSARETAAPAATVDQVVAAARSGVVGTIAHDQGRSERRTRLNTPVEAVVMYVGFSNLRDARALLHRTADIAAPTTPCVIRNAGSADDAWRNLRSVVPRLVRLSSLGAAVEEHAQARVRLTEL